MRRMTIGLVAGVLAAGAAATAGWTQISPGSEPFMVGSDEFELIQQEGVQIWRGRAEATQGENRLRAGEIRVYHDVQDGGFGQAQFGDLSGNTLTVPETALRYDADGVSVMVVGADNKVKRAGVKTGRRGGGYAELISGPPEGTRVLLGASSIVLEGDTVRPVDAPAPAARPAAK